MTSALAILVCWAVSFLFSGIEAGLLALDPIRLRSQVKQNQPTARRLYRLVKKPERLLATVLVVTSMADILALLILTRALIRALGPAGFFLAVAVALPIYVFFLGALPKSLFRRFPSRALSRAAGLLELVSKMLWPLLELVRLLSYLFLSQRQRRQANLLVAREDLKHITAQSEREGSLTPAERMMIHNVVDFGGVKVRDVMIPISQAVVARPHFSIGEVLELSASRQVDRLPVVGPDKSVVGLVNVMDIIYERQPPNELGECVRRGVTVREGDSAYLVYRRLRAARFGLAAVVDRRNKLRGVVTTQALIQRLISIAPVAPKPESRASAQAPME